MALFIMETGIYQMMEYYFMDFVTRTALEALILEKVLLDFVSAWGQD
jgi:hypothetical protein